MLRVRVCGGVEVEADGHVLPDALLSGRQGRLVLAYLVCERHRAVRREELAELLWPERLPDSWPASISAVVSRLRRLFSEAGLDGAAVLASLAGAYQLQLPEGSSVDIEVLAAAAADAEEAARAGDLARTHESAAEAERIAARGFLVDDCEWVDHQRDVVRDHRVRAALALSTAELAAGAASRAVEAARDALALDPSREEAYRQLMRALAASGERGEALRVWERCRIALVEELGIDPSPETEGVYLEILGAAPTESAVTTALPSGVVTFLLTDIVESSGLWEHHPKAMAVVLERHDTIVGEIVAAHGGTLLKSKLEGDATVSVFARATGGAAAALALLEALAAEPWPEGAVPRLRMAMHTGEAFERNGDYFGPALNRAARLRSLAGAGQVLLSQAVAEVVRDHLPTDVVLLDRGHRDLRGLSRGENVYELARSGGDVEPSVEVDDASALILPSLPPVLAGATPFVGRGDELDVLSGLWDRVVGGEPRAVVIGGEPGVGKSRLAGELAARAHATGAIVLYGRCDEDLAAPLQPFIEPVRVLAPTLGPTRLRAVRGVAELRRVVPELADLLSEDAPTMRADPDTERLALFDAVTHLLRTASLEAPVLLVLDDLHWAGKTTLSLLRHLLLGAKDARLLVVGTYRDTELGRTHPLAATLADLRRDGATDRVVLGGLDAADIAAYLTAIGNTDRALGRELAEVTSGNPFFLIEVLRHVEETGGAWEPGSLPEGVRDATGRRLSRLSDATNEALSVAAVVGATFDLELVEQVRGIELVDEIAEACQAGLVAEEVGTPNHFRFAHALVRQVLLTELVTLKRVRLHRTIAELLEASVPATDPDARLADLAYHWFECATTGGAEKAVEACRHAGDRAMERLAYEEAGDLYGMALQALDVVDDADEEARAALHLARCDALLTAGDVAGARGAIDALERAAHGSERLAAWFTTYAGQLAVLAEPDRLTEIVQSIGAAAGAMRAAGDLTGEAKAHYVHASALERLGQIGAAERALDAALAAARGAGDRRLQDAILAEAPPAALWGPSPVTRASGRCLDVVRVLRITAGAPAVESVALRCQAVLEALRGRMDAARRMIGSARRTVEQLGLAHRRLETEVAAGFIELLDGEAVAAETHLRAAYDELRDRGLGGEAAQAAAFLGRALLLQDRVDEADQVATEAEALAGSDLKAAIAWRDVRAEAAVRRGDTIVALELAREAVELATATDALLLVADARLTLALVLRATGDTAAAEAEAQRAVDACETKGATVLAARARAATRSPGPARVAPAAPTAPAVRDKLGGSSTAFVFENDAVRAAARMHAAYRDHDWEALHTSYDEDFCVEDRRSFVSVSLDREQSMASNRLVFDGGGWFRHDVLATRGRWLALERWDLTIPGQLAEASVLCLIRTSDDGLYLKTVLFDVNDHDSAFAELDRTYAEFEASEHAAIVGRLSTSLAERHEGGGSLRIEHVPRLSATAGVCVVLADDGTRSVDVFTHDGDHIRGLDFFSEDLDAALARFDQLEGKAPSEAFANAAWRASLRFKAASDAQDWDALVGVLSPQFELHDRRTVVFDLTGAAPLDTYRVAFELDEYHLDVHLVATRGESLALVEHLTTFRDGVAGLAETASLTVVEVDADERIVHHVSLDADALTDAFDELDERYVELGGPDVRPYRHAFGARDWERFGGFFTPDCLFEDRRVVGYGILDREGFVGMQRDLLELASDVQLCMDGVIATSATASLTIGRYVGTRDGGPFEMSLASLAALDGQGRITSLRLYDLDDLDAARVEYDRLTSPSVTDRFANAAWRATRRLMAFLNARNWDALVASFSPRYETHDRRTGVDLFQQGAEALSVYRAAFDLDEYHLDVQLLATRGESLALVKLLSTFRDGVAGPAEVEALQVVEVDTEELIVHLVGFDADALEDAFDELDARYVASGGADVRSYCRAFDARDWDALTSLIAPEFVVHDHRSAGLGSITREGWVDYERSLTELAPDARLWTAHAVTEGNAVIVVSRAVGSRDGGPWELADVSVAVFDGDGLTTSIDAYELADINDAWARFEQLAARSTDGPFANAAWRACRRLTRAENARDWDAISATFSPHYERHDRRIGVVLDQHGADALSVYRVAFELDEYRVDRQVVATRGESLVLTKTLSTFRDGAAGWSEVEVLAVLQVDDDERIVYHVGFEADAFDDALDELDARYVASGGPDFRPARHAFDARDWEAFAALFAPGCVMIDVRTAGWGSITRDEFVEYMQAAVELAPDARLWSDHAINKGAIGLVASRLFGTRDGGSWELAFLSVAESDGDGLTLSAASYELADIDAARARFDELAAQSAEEPFANAAWRASQRSTAAENARDWDGLVATLSPRYEFHDRLAGMALDYGVADSLATWRIAFDLDEYHVERQLVATRGGSLALTRVVIAFRDGAAGSAELESLTVVEVDADERIVHAVRFDSNMLEEAFDELDARYVALGGFDLRQSRHAFDARDWEACASLFHPDCVVHHHRSPGQGTITRDEFVASQRSLVELAPDAHIWTDHAVSRGNVTMTAGRSSGTRDGGAWELPVLSVATHGADGRIQTCEIYELVDIDVARARFDELAAESTDEPLTNAAWRASQRSTAASNARDWDAMVATFSPRYERHDRRTGMAVDDHGAEPLGIHRAAFELDEYHVDRQLVATRGETFALTKELHTFRDGAVGPSEIESLTVVEVDADGQIVHHVFFDADALDDAYDELDARFNELVARSTDEPFANDAWRAMIALERAAQTRDWDALTSTLSPKYVDQDRRSGISLVISGDEALATYRTMFSLDECQLHYTLLATRGDRLALGSILVRFRDGASGPAEVACLQVVEVDTDGRVLHGIAFDADDLEGAFDELDARYVGLGGRDKAAVRKAFSARDWDAFASFFEPGHVVTDHRLTRWGRLEGDEFLEYQRQIVALSPDAEIWIDHVVASEGVELVVTGPRGTRDGGPWMLPTLSVVTYSDRGRIATTDIFEPDDITLARAHYDELVALRRAPRPNRASKVLAAQDEAFARRDREAYRAAYREGGRTVDDRRSVVGGAFSEAESLANLDYMFNLPAVTWTRRLIATRGDLLALVEDRIEASDGDVLVAELSFLTLAELDSGGCIVRHTVFDVDDLDAAMVELDTGHAAP